MSKLEILENKKLVLKNVVIKELRNISLEDVEKEISQFVNKLDILKVQTFGPLIIKSCGTNILEDGQITTDYDLMVQAHDYKQYKNEYKIIDRFQCPHCVYVRYEGNPIEVNYANMKLDLYFYENDLTDNGELYTVCIHDSEEYVMTDLFRPMVIV